MLPYEWQKKKKKKDFTYVITFRILRWGEYPRLPGGPYMQSQISSEERGRGSSETEETM